MIQLDKLTRDAIAASVARATTEANEVYQEQWLTGEQLCEEIPLFTRQWLKLHGQRIPRECICVVDENGVQHRSRWCYPKKKLLRMIKEGTLRRL